MAFPADILKNIGPTPEAAKLPENKGKLIVTIGCSAERYLSTALAEDARKSVGG